MPNRRQGRPSPRRLAIVLGGWALAVLAAFPARAEVALQAVRWQMARREKGQGPRYEDIAALRLEGGRLAGRVRARLSLLNRGPRSVEGILLRYGVAAKIAPGGTDAPGVWGVPFMIEERRVPKVGPNQIQEVSLETGMLPIYLGRLSRAGYRPRELRLQVMIEPRRGETSPVRLLESVLPLAP